MKISTDNYLAWNLVAEFHLKIMGLEKIIEKGNKVKLVENAKVIFFLRYHIDNGLKKNTLKSKIICLCGNN